MKFLVKLILLSLIVIQQGCQTINEKKMPSARQKALVKEQKQLHNLFMRGMQYQELSTEQQKSLCEQLKQEHQISHRWQTAWLLVYSLNDDYGCVEQSETMDLLNSIQSTQGVSAELLWLNKKQIHLHKKIYQNNKLQTKLDKSQKKNKNLKNQLIKEKEEVQEVNSKIKALKTIETNINKKLEDEETIGQ